MNDNEFNTNNSPNNNDSMAPNDLKTNDADPSKVRPDANQNNSNKENNNSNSNDFNNASNDIDKASDTADQAADVADKASDTADRANKVDDTPLGAANSIKNAVQEAGNAAEQFKDGDLYGNSEDGVTETVNDMKDVALGGAEAVADTGLAVGKALAGDTTGAVKSAADAVRDVFRIIPALIKITVPLVIIGLMIISLILRSPAMIWKGITQSYEQWAYSQAVSAIDMGISDAAFNVVNQVSETIEDFTEVKYFKAKCNRYYMDYMGNGYVKDFEDGTSLSIELQPSIDGTHEDAYITVIDKNNRIYTIIYKNADITYSDFDSDVPYSEIIAAFCKYREKIIEEGGAPAIYHTFTNEIQEQIVNLGNKYYEEDYSLSDFNSDTASLLEVTEEDKANSVSLNFTGKNGEMSSEDSWGVADTGALYYYMTHDTELSSALFDYTVTNNVGEDITDANLSKDKDLAAVGSQQYEVTIDVTTFEINDMQTPNGSYYSSSVMNAFGITDEYEIEEVVQQSLMSNMLLSVADGTPELSGNYKNYITVSQPKILFEKIVGGPSVLEKIIDSGIYADITVDQVRNMMADQALMWTKRTKMVSASEETFFFRTNDEFVDAFKGTTTGYSYDSATGTWSDKNTAIFDPLDAKKYLGEDGTFMTYLFSRSLNSGQLKDDDGYPLRARTYIFPEVYTSNNSDKNVKQMFSSEEYYYYFQENALNGSLNSSTASNSAWYQLSKYCKGTDNTAWDNAFDTSLTDINGNKTCIEKGDMLFFTYFNSDLTSPSAITSAFKGDYDIFYGNKGYQVGLVTNVDYDSKTINVALYNFDEDPIKISFIEDTYDNVAQQYLGTQGLKVDNITISYSGNGEGTVTPEWDDSTINALQRINKVLESDNQVWEPNPLNFVTGYGKPDYLAYVDEVNRRLIPLREEMQKRLAEAAMDLGGGSLGYPVDTSHRNVSNGYGVNGHQGIDYAIPVGTPIYASEDGTVIRSEAITSGGSLNYQGTPVYAPNGQKYRSYGEVITIQHGSSGLVTYYAHLSKRSVNKNDTVKRGQLIGYSGNTGNSTGPHLHFEVRKNNVVQNPNNYLSDVVTQKRGNYTYTLNTYISTSPVNGRNINVTFYCPGSCCNGSGAGITASGLKITNTKKYYDQNQAYVACNWLPIGTKIAVDFGNSSSMGPFKDKTYIYTVQDTGSAPALSTDRIDIFVPNDHDKLNIGSSAGNNHVKIKIISLGNGSLNIS